jgi:Zn-dependent protease
MQIADTIFVLVIVVFSAIIHEVMHGAMADWLGDHTARYAGRLTLNPFVHLDPMGSVVIPIFLAISDSPIFFAYAKPVPYNPYNLRPGRFSEALVAFAGPASNATLALLVGLFIRTGIVGTAVSSALFLVVVVNVMLCIFNLIPIPPLDGSKILTALLPSGLSYQWEKVRTVLESNPIIGMIIVVLLVYSLGSAFSNVIYGVAHLIAG